MPSVSKIHAIAALLGWLGAVAIAGTDCTGMSCGSVDVNPGGMSAWEPRTSFTPDLRPMAYIALRNGYPGNDLGLRPDWYDRDLEFPSGPPTDTSPSNGVPDSFDWLLGVLDDCYDRGFRRITLGLPAGAVVDEMGVPEGDLMPSSQWWTMTEWRRDAFEEFLAEWIDEKEEDPVDIGIYAGFLVRDACDLYLGNHNPADMEYPGPLDTTDSSIMCTLNKNLQPWIDIGITEYWADNAASSADMTLPNWESALLLHESADYDGILRFGGEAIPSDDQSTCQLWTMNTDAIEGLPWLGTFAFVEPHYRNTAINPSVNELHIRLSGHSVSTGACASAGNQWTYEDALHYYENGWVIDFQPEYSSSTVNYSTPGHGMRVAIGMETVQRLYDFGVITALLDFNGDGVIEVGTSPAGADYTAFVAAYLANSSGPGNYLEGDMNNDGDVDILDVNAFQSAKTAWDNYGTVISLDLGDPD